MADTGYLPANERIKVLLAAKKIKVTDLAEALQQPYRTIYNYIDARTEVRMGLIEKIAQLYPDISADWLLTGTGSMYKSARQHADIAETDNPLSEAHPTYKPDCAEKINLLERSLKEKTARIDELNRWLDDKERLIQVLFQRIERMEKDPPR